jgi:SAM-dependent methyltransferase
VSDVDPTPTGAEAEGLPPLVGVRCPRCLGTLAERSAGLVCNACGAAYERGPSPATLRIGEPVSRFEQELDAKVSVLEPLLDGLRPPACTEAVIAALADDVGIEIGNPVWEGRFDVARALPQASGVVLDLGCGFGTSTVALARSAQHVLALDTSPARVRLTAARLRAEGLRNATVIQSDGIDLPVGDGVCDLVTIVGVLEWMSLGSPDPLSAQRAALRAAERVLRPGGVLLLGIENRYGAHYFSGMAEEHVGLPFVSLLPRRLGDLYARSTGRGRVTTYTHSRRVLLRLLREAGLDPRLGPALPSYGQPQFVFDEEVFRVAWDFYLRHVFHYSSPARRLVGALAAHSPPTGRTVAPSFFAIGRKGVPPDPLPTVVTGTPDCQGNIKTIDWNRHEVGHRPRLDVKQATIQPLLDGWNGRRWLSAPIRERERRRRECHVLRAASELLAQRPARAVDGDVRDRSLREAKDALQRLGARLAPGESDWCTGELEGLDRDDAPLVHEHGDFVTGNLVVADDGTLVALDASGGWAVPGRDAVMLVLDLFALRAGTKVPDVDVGLRMLAAADAARDRAARLAAELLDAELRLRFDVRRAARLALLAVLRHHAARDARASLPGIRRFVTRAHSGELLALLESRSRTLADGG